MSGTSRRTILRGLVLASLAPLAGSWWALSRFRRLRSRRSRVSLPLPATDGLSFDREVILQRRGDTLRALSARCSHLGCIIDRSVDGELICPCHGSRFTLDGRPSRGPATRPLQELRVEPSTEAGTLIVALDS